MGRSDVGGFRITSGSHIGRTGTVEVKVFHNTMDYSDEYAHGFHVTLDDGKFVTVRRDQVSVNRAKQHIANRRQRG